MKQLLFVLLAGFVMISFSCKKETNTVNNSSAPVSANALLTGSDNFGNRSGRLLWTINSFVINGNDITSQFADYNFQFRDGSLLIADKGQASVNGKWKIVSENQLFIVFNPEVSDGILTELNENWVIRAMSLNDIVLESNTQSYTKSLVFHTDGELLPY